MENALTVTKDTSLIEKPIVAQMLATLERNDVISIEDNKFLQDHKESLQLAFVNTWMWRTKGQHESIISDQFHPSLHSKFHQAILEQKVQFGESIRLAKEYATRKLDKEEKLIQLEEIDEEMQACLSVKTGHEPSERQKREARKVQIRKNRIEIELQEIEYQLNEMKVAMDYRMKEVKSWESIKEVLKQAMLKLGLSEQDVYNKEYEEIESAFYTFLNNVNPLGKSTDAAEVNNIIGLAKWAIMKAKQAGLYAKFFERCTKEQVEALKIVESI